MADLLSSPDPLNDSPTFHSPVKTRRASNRRNSLQLRSSSPTKQTFELDVGDRISPQKIRVTVEAGSDKENGYSRFVEGPQPGETSPSRLRTTRRRVKTTTTKVPVKGLSDSEDNGQEGTPPKRGRGRPRKSTGTPVPASKGARTSTPTRRRRKSIGDLVGGDDDEDTDFRIGNDVQVGRGKGRSRSRSTKANSRKSTPAAKNAEDGATSSATTKKGRGRRKSLLPEEVIVLDDDNSGTVPELEDQEPEADGILGDIDGNEAYTPSAYSTIRSTTTIGMNDPDVVIAIFDPGNETPRKTGWSSPRIIEGLRASSPPANTGQSPSIPPEKNAGQYKENDGRISEHSRGSAGRSGDEEEQYDDLEEDGLGEIPEFDTILESEGFSMISVDSVPSLQEHLSSPANEDEKEPSNGIRSQTPTSVKGLGACPRIASTSKVPKNAIESATTTRKAQDPSFLSIQNSRNDDTFSSIPPEVLEVATPGRKTHLSRLQSQRNSRAEDSFSSIAPEILEAATPGRNLPNTNFRQPNKSQVYEDSFSTIPSAILDAATPAPARHSSPKSKSTQVNTASDKLAMPAFTRTISSGRGSSHSVSTRLPTPDETPSPPADTIHEASGSSNSPLPPAAPTHQASANESSIHSQMRSSPPSVAPRRYTYTAHFRQKRELYPDVTQTPSIVFSSPALPPPIHIARGQSTLAVQTEEVERPGLSPIARAGRALQDAVGPTLSPRARALSLGSPFKSPVAEGRSSSSVAPSNLSPSQDQRTKSQLQSGNLFPNPWNRSTQHDDPFSNNAPARQQSTALVTIKQAYTLGLPEQHRLAEPRLSTIRSEDISVLSDDAMSWQAEEEVTVDDATTSLVNNINSIARERSSSAQPNQQTSTGTVQTLEQKWAAERDAIRKQIQNANSSQVILIDSDGDASAEDGLDEDSEDFGLLLETINSSSPAVQKTQVLPKENFEKPRRSKIPSPWRKNSKRLVYSDELSHMSSPMVSAKVPLGEGLAYKGTCDDNNIDLSSFVIPQKAGFQPKVRETGNLDLSALLASSSPNKSRPPILKSSQPRAVPLQKPSFSSASSLLTGDDSSSASQPRSFAPIPQKANFEPRNHNTEASSVFESSPLKPNAYVNSIFGVREKGATGAQNPTPELSSSSAAEPLGVSSPSRTNVLRVSTQKTPAQDSEADCSYTSKFSPTRSEEEKEIQSIDNCTLKWTENVRLASAQTQPLISPPKPCLRSPLKTPSNGFGSDSNGTNMSPSKKVAFVSSSPLPSSSVSEPLSSTTWSKDHWKLLQLIWYEWRPENNGGSTDGPRGRRRNSTRVISRLLGRRVFYQDKEMRLQQWHLEVVDEFRGKVPGWEEKVIAMRLFSLMVGEKQRSAGLNVH